MAIPDQSNESNKERSTSLEDTADNAGARTAAVNHNPAIALEEARNAAEGKGPNASGSIAPGESENFVPSTSDPEATDLPSANKPTP